MLRKNRNRKNRKWASPCRARRVRQKRLKPEVDDSGAGSRETPNHKNVNVSKGQCLSRKVSTTYQQSVSYNWYRRVRSQLSSQISIIWLTFSGARQIPESPRVPRHDNCSGNATFPVPLDLTSYHQPLPVRTLSRMPIFVFLKSGLTAISVEFSPAWRGAEDWQDDGSVCQTILWLQPQCLFKSETIIPSNMSKYWQFMSLPKSGPNL